MTFRQPRKTPLNPSHCPMLTAAYKVPYILPSPYTVSPLFATLTKTAGVGGYLPKMELVLLFLSAFNLKPFNVQTILQSVFNFRPSDLHTSLMTNLAHQLTCPAHEEVGF